MRRSLLLALLLVVACGGDDPAFVVQEPPPAVVSAGEVTFAPSAPLDLGVGQSIELVVATDPPSATGVYVSLDGDHADASLDRGWVAVDGSGMAKVTLYGPSRAGTFDVVASIDAGGVARRTVRASGGGTATVKVQPQYGGKRALGELVVTARPNERCADHPEMPVADGPLGVKGAVGESVAITDVPLAPTVLVAVRSGKAASGCIDVAGLHLGETRAVIVGLADAPMRIAPVKLEVQLAVVPDAEAWPLALSTWRSRFSAAYTGGADKAVKALLDTMAAALPPGEAVLFTTARQKNGWDAALPPVMPNADAVAKTWLPAATAALLVEPGALSGTLSASSGSMGFAVLVPSSVLGVTPTDAPLEAKKVTWSTASEGSDTVVTSGSFTVPPSRVLAAAVAAWLAETGQGPVPAALGAVLPCEAVKGVLAPSGNAFASCDGACVKAKCEAAVTAMWARAVKSDETSGHTLSIAFGASGSAVTDAEAALVSFAGTWSGSMTESGAAPVIPKLSVKGSAHGVP